MVTVGTTSSDLQKEIQLGMRADGRHTMDDSGSGASGLDYRRNTDPRRSGGHLDRITTLARLILRRLGRLYPNAHCALHFRNEYELLIAVILSAQCTDQKVNAAVPALFARFPEPRELASATPSEVEPYIRTLGLFRSKARHIVGAARGLTENVQWSIEGLTRLPGVGRKTANVVLSETRGINEGIAVDTHCGRLARRFGLTRSEDPKRIEVDLMNLYPRKNWALVTHRFIAHGRAICAARSPRCRDCGVRNLCPSARVHGDGD